jgi:hypothetical protein
MKRLFLIPFALFSSFLFAQEFHRYTFSEDFQFVKESDLYGYVFVPSEGKMSEAMYPNSVQEGIVSFTVNSFYVLIDERSHFTPAGISGEVTDDKPYQLNISRINKTTYGYELRLMNSKNRDLQGHLKIYLNGYSQVTQLKYRPTTNDPEHTYFIKSTPKNQLKLDSKFFTHQLDVDVSDMEEVFGNKLYPFISIDHHNLKDQRKTKRIYPSDNIDIHIENRMVTKGKKEKSMPCMVFNTTGGLKKVLLLKKAKESELPVNEGGRKILEIPAKDLQTQEEFRIILHRGAKSKLKAVELQKSKSRECVLYYQMRYGKRMIE